MMSAKLAIPGLLKIKISQNKGYNVIILDYDVTDKILSNDSNYIINVIMWPKFGNSSISFQVIMTSIYLDLTKKTHIFWGVVLIQVQ